MYGITEKFYGIIIDNGVHGIDMHGPFVQKFSEYMDKQPCKCDDTDEADYGCDPCYWQADAEDFIGMLSEYDLGNKDLCFRSSYSGSGTSPLAFGVSLDSSPNFEVKELESLFTKNNDITEELVEEYEQALNNLERIFPGLSESIREIKPEICYYSSTS